MTGILIPWVIATTILMFVAAYWIYLLEQRVHGLEERYEGLLNIADAVEGAPSQAVLLPLVQRLDAHETRLGQVETQLGAVTKILPHTVRGLGIVRYNAFEGVAGDQSFSLALVDAGGYGAIVTGLHNGSAVRVYAKPLSNWKSSYSLSPDEQRALGAARRMAEGGEPA